MNVILLFLYFGFLLTLILSLLGKWRTKAPDPNSLTHDAITTVLKDLEHPDFDGVCYGFTLNWALATATHKEKLFYRQIHLLRVHQTNVPAAIARVMNKKRHNKLLTADEKVIETLPALCKRICIAQDPLEYKMKYGKLVWQADIPAILNKISSKSARPRHIFYKTHTFASKQEAESYFNLLQTIGINSKVAVMISSSDHAMGFRRSGHLWRFININDLYQQQVNHPYFMFTSEQLVNELYRVSTTGPLVRRLTVNTDFIALRSYNQLFQSLHNVFPAFPLNSRTTYPEKISFFVMAALQGDILTVKKCLNSGWPIFFNCQMGDNSPLLTAIYQGRREVVKTMLASTHFRINQRHKKNGATLLHLACKYGGAGMVEDLLEMKRIDINAQDNKGRTPLMIACQSTIITNEAALFGLLLNKGASLVIKDKEGLTALDHAIRNKHTFAIKMIKIKLQTQRSQSLTPPARTPSKATSFKATFFNKVGRKLPAERSLESGLHEQEQWGICKNDDLLKTSI
ncbi:Dot/Icm T4SS effector AnkG/AnkZ/LegA7 [Legionella maioricensis]|uniref:Ankyrin repeat domain-containing protein n=1 Tax=Legionella maioricensis TaxID=2896528 RepID=A0A9X2CYK5_9GAMM|nr:Dot/Icm T4SS effector AnkG/AnkZ/LegA7 [Legionella maioricensis]MCL9683275.1 ankyrin repeat domain-containing protein [Legionella maioricensis]MCL9686028.1 ankyrin repeat domain-containing protein [Legionella maioricensis]